MANHLSRLHQFIVTHYALDDLRALSFDLAVEYDDLPGEGRQSKARELVRWLARRGQLDQLLQRLQQTRPTPFATAGLALAVGDLVFQTYREESGQLLRHIRTREFQNLVNERTREFVGRQFVFKAINDFLADAGFPSGYIVIQGEPGIGKTAIMAQLVRQKGYVHHFNIAPQNIRSARDFLASVSAQLITQFELDHAALPDAATSDSGFLSQLLDEAAAKADGPVVVLLDALDEAEDSGLPPDANRLYLPPTLPPNTFFIVTTRQQADYRLFVDRREDIYLRDADPGNLADVRQYIHNYLRAHADQMAGRLSAWDATNDDFITIMTEKSQGNFMYLVHVLRDIRTGRLTAATLDDIRQLPHGLRAYYQRHWRLMRAQDGGRFAQEYESVVCYLAVAREPVSLPQLAAWAQVPPRRVRDILNAWREFLNVDEGPAETLYRLYHASFQDFLKEEVGLTRFHDGIAQAALDKIQW